MIRKYRLTRLAKRDLDEIWEYISNQDPAAAERVLEALYDKFPLLAAQPGLGRPRDELQPGLRSFAVGNYVIFFEVKDSRILIVRVLHGARDLAAIFRSQ